MTTPHVYRYDSEETIPDDVHDHIVAAVGDEWPWDDNANELVNPSLHPTYFVSMQDGTLQSYGRTIWALGTAGEHKFKVYGLGDVVTPATWRRSGYGSAVVAAATSHIRSDATADVAVLHTEHRLHRLYAHHGWTSINHFSCVTDEKGGEGGAAADGPHTLGPVQAAPWRKPIHCSDTSWRGVVSCATKPLRDPLF